MSFYFFNLNFKCFLNFIFYNNFYTIILYSGPSFIFLVNFLFFYQVRAPHRNLATHVLLTRAINRIKVKGSEGERLGQLMVTPEVVANKINNMKENKSPGVDGIAPKILKETVEQICTPLV